MGSEGAVNVGRGRGESWNAILGEKQKKTGTSNVNTITLNRREEKYIEEKNVYLKTVLWVTVLCINLRHAAVCEVQKKKKKDKSKVYLLCVKCMDTGHNFSCCVFLFCSFFFFFFYPVTKPFCFFLVFRRHTCCIKHCLFFIKWAAAKCKTQTSLSCLLKLIVAAQGKVSGSRRGLVTSPQFSAECGSSPSFFFLVLDAAAWLGVSSHFSPHPLIGDFI